MLHRRVRKGTCKFVEHRMEYARQIVHVFIESRSCAVSVF